MSEATDEQRIAELVIELSCTTRYTHVWWDQQVRLLMSSGLAKSIDDAAYIARKCASAHVPPSALVAVSNAYSKAQP